MNMRINSDQKVQNEKKILLSDQEAVRRRTPKGGVCLFCLFIITSRTELFDKPSKNNMVKS